MSKSKVLIVDDSTAARRGLRALLAIEPTVQVVGEAAGGWEAMRLMEQQHPDVVLMDSRMQGMDGLEATRQIKGRWPQVRVVVVTMYPGHRAEALAAGADAFLVKGCPAGELLDAVLGSGDPGSLSAPLG